MMLPPGQADPPRMSVPIKQRGLADFPFYAGDPVPIQSTGWLLLLSAVVAGFAALVSLSFERLPWSMVPSILLVGIPLTALGLVAGPHWRALFRAIGPRDFGMMVGTAIATMLVSAVALTIAKFTTAIANPLSASVTSMSAADLLWHLGPTLPQLLGEEVLTVIPFLAILWLATGRLGMARHAGIVAALIGSTAIFASAHLPTYQWNWVQCFGTIGAARLVLTLSYIWTRNLWVCTGAHVINDWIEFALIFGVSHFASGAG